MCICCSDVCSHIFFVQASCLKRIPRQKQIEVELERPKNTSRSRGGHPASSTLLKGGKVSDAQWGLGLFPHASRTRTVGLEEIRAEVRQLDEKFNNI